MTAIAINGARQTVAAPERRERRFGLFSVVTPVDSPDAHWMLGGLTADGEECSKPEAVDITCGPTANKTARSWYSDVEGDPWLAYMYETCKTVGRYSEAGSRLRERFLASEQSAVEDGLFHNVLLPGADTVTGTDAAHAIGQLEDVAAADFGGEITVYLTFTAAAQAAPYLVRVGDRLETLAGSRVAVGNFSDDGSIFASGGLVLHRSPLVVSGPVVNRDTNDYFVLAERSYAALVDCWHAQATYGTP